MAKMGRGNDMTNHVNEIKATSEHLEALIAQIAEHDLVIILISSIPEDFIYLITALETISTLTWDYVRDRLIHESDKLQKSNGNEMNDALFTNNQTERSNKMSLLQEKGKHSSMFYRIIIYVNLQNSILTGIMT